MRGLPAESVDAVVTDPPYELGFMGKSWDSAGVSYDPATWAEALRVLKSGGHLLAFGGSRTYHRIAVAIEDAGFEIRDSLMWIYGSGFPKSLDVSKAMDKKAGAKRQVVGPNHHYSAGRTADPGSFAQGGKNSSPHITAPATEEAKRWEGWGTALKPSHEPIVLARKPLIGTVAENVLAHGTGALNIGASRIGDDSITTSHTVRPAGDALVGRGAKATGETSTHIGRWPANTLWDEEAAAQLDEQSGVRTSGKAAAGGHKRRASLGGGNDTVPIAPRTSAEAGQLYGDSGGASRFFYVAKPGKRERNAGLDGMSQRKAAKNGSGLGRSSSLEQRIASQGHDDTVAANIHPTVKPIALMRYLIKLITPPGGVVLDPFLGSGTTACAAVLEGFDYIGIEMTPDYADIAEARIAHYSKEETNG
jgi:site-specific DNA-methyltransferase (adenine-specific)